MEQKSIDQNHQTNTNENGENNQFVITPWQSTSLVASTVVGVGVLTLPRVTSAEAHEAAWMVTILGGMLALLSIWLCTKLGLRFPSQTFVRFAPELLGNRRYLWIGACLLFFCLWSIGLSLRL